MSEVNSIFPSDEAKKVIEVGNAITQADNALLKYTKDAEKLVELLKSQNISFEQLAKAQAKAKKTTEDIDAVGKQLVQSQKKLMEVRDRDYKMVLEKRAQTQKEAKDIKNLIRAQQAQRGSIEQLSAVNAILEKRLKSVNLQTEEGRKRAERLRGAIDRNTKSIMANSSQYSSWKINVGNYNSALSGLSPTFGRVSMAANQASKAFKLLLANPVVLVISAIVAAFAGLVAIFKSTDDGGTKLQGVFDGIKNVLGVLKNALTQVIEAFSLIRDGKFREAFQKIGEATKFAKDNMVDAYNAGYLYAQSLDAINDRITANISGQAKTLRQFREYIALSKDQTLSDQERIDNLNKAQQAAEEYYGTLRDDARDTYELEVANLASRTKLTTEQLDEFIKLSGKEAEIARKNNADIANAWNVLGDENIKSLEEMYAKMDEADTQYFKRTSEITSLRTGLVKKSSQQRIAAEEKAAQDLLNIRDKFEEELENKRQKRAEDELKAGEELIEADIAKIEERVEIEKAGIEEIDRLRAEKRQKEQEEEQAELQRKAELYQNFTNIIADSFFDFAQGNKDALKEGAKAIIITALDVLKAQTQMAIVGATVQSLVQPDSIATFGASGLARAAIITGLIEAAFAATQGIVAGFAEGTDNAPGRFVAGEKGRELMMLRTGEIMMVDKPTYFEGSKYKGATIKSNSETEKIIAQSDKRGSFVFDDKGLRDDLKAVRRAIERKPVNVIDHKSGSIIGKQSGNYREIYINKLRNGR